MVELKLLTMMLKKNILLCSLITFLMVMGNSLKISAQQKAPLDTFALHKMATFTNMKAALVNPEAVYILDLSKKKLDSLPPEIVQFKNLQILNVSKNKLSRLPDFLAQLPNLQHLDASKNKLEMLPDSIGFIQNLINLDLGRNLIPRLPKSFGNLTKLEVLNLWDNELGGLPPEIKKCQSLRYVELRGILFTPAEQVEIEGLLPEGCKIMFSPDCNCKD